MIIEQPSKWLRWLYPDALWRMNSEEKSVYLTFDDGPIPEATPIILDILDEYDAKATFFMVGENVSKYPRLKDEIASRGHRLGNHTFNHLGGLEATSKEYLWNIHLADRLIRTPFFRPPRGWMFPLQYMRVRRRMVIVMWDVVTRDYSKMLNADEVYRNVRKYTRNGSIITFHDSLRSIDKLRVALPLSLKWLKEQGYEFKVFDENQTRGYKFK